MVAALPLSALLMGCGAGGPSPNTTDAAAITPTSTGRANGSANVAANGADTPSSTAGSFPERRSRRRFAGTVNVATNLAVMFGANLLARAVTIDSNGPGNTIVKANTFAALLSCTLNNPAPTNAGQPNTGPGAKTGQCAGL